MAWYDEEDMWPSGDRLGRYNARDPYGLDKYNTSPYMFGQDVDTLYPKRNSSAGMYSRATSPGLYTDAVSYPKAPKPYDWGPTERYSSYLNKEPQREDYQLKGWGKILGAAQAGLVGYQTGDLRQAIKVGDELKERPYRQAYNAWETRGKPYAREVELENQRYKIGRDEYNQQQDNWRQEATQRLAMEKHRMDVLKYNNELDEKELKLANEGWQLKGGLGNESVWVRRNPLTQQEEIQPSRIPKERLNALDQQIMEASRQKNANFNAAAGRQVAMRGQDMSSETARLGREQGQRQFEAREDRILKTTPKNQSKPKTQQDFISTNFGDMQQNGFIKFKPGSTEVDLMAPEQAYRRAIQVATEELKFEGPESIGGTKVGGEPSMQQIEERAAKIMERYNQAQLGLYGFGWVQPRQGYGRGY